MNYRNKEIKNYMTIKSAENILYKNSPIICPIVEAMEKFVIKILSFSNSNIRGFSYFLYFCALKTISQFNELELAGLSKI